MNEKGAVYEEKNIGLKNTIPTIVPEYTLFSNDRRKIKNEINLSLIKCFSPKNSPIKGYPS